MDGLGKITQYIQNKMYNRPHNCNNAFTLEAIPSKTKQQPTKSILHHRPKRLVIVAEDEDRRLLGHRKDSSEGYTYYETHPYQYQECEREDPTSVELESNSCCPSIENGIFENMLSNLQEEIKLKSHAFSVAESIVKREEQNVRNLQKENKNLRQQLEVALKKVQDLELQLLQEKTHKYDQSTTKKSITKTYITEKNITLSNQNQEPLKLISSEIFNQFAKSYEGLVNELSAWICKEKEEELNDSIFSKLQMHKAQVEELLNGKSEQQYSKTTYQTLLQNNGSEWGKTKAVRCSSYNQYDQAIDKYRQYCNKLSVQLCESINFIQELSKALDKAINIYSKITQPQTIIPSELIKLVTKECNKIINSKFTQLKNENLELINIIEEMISWIEKNSKDGGEKFRNSFSAML